jgi:hypothetical protein
VYALLATAQLRPPTACPSPPVDVEPALHFDVPSAVPSITGVAAARVGAVTAGWLAPAGGCAATSLAPVDGVAGTSLAPVDGCAVVSLAPLAGVAPWVDPLPVEVPPPPPPPQLASQTRLLMTQNRTSKSRDMSVLRKID